MLYSASSAIADICCLYPPKSRRYIGTQEYYILIETRPDRGFLLENSVLKDLRLALAPLHKLRFWRTKQGAEVDFVVIKEGTTLLPIEVKSQLNRPALSLGLRSFIEKFKPKRALLINLTIYNSEIKVGGTRIYFIHPFELPKYL
jgi:predicted AAA+ superfamily ATPase